MIGTKNSNAVFAHPKAKRISRTLVSHSLDAISFSTLMVNHQFDNASMTVAVIQRPTPRIMRFLRVLTRKRDKHYELKL